jgi:uroporphyrinogen decarboxylase
LIFVCFTNPKGKNMTAENWLAAPRPAGRNADFNELAKVLRKEAPSRPTLFEFFLNAPLYDALAGAAGAEFRTLDDADLRFNGVAMLAFYNAGYDHFTLHASDFHFTTENRGRAKSISMSHGGIITDRESYDKYQWTDPADFSYSRLDNLRPHLREGMKFVVYSSGGVLENVTALVGYEDLCFMINDDPELTQQVFDQVGARLLKYYALALEHDGIGAVITNDDWGFNTQTMLPPNLLRQYVFPWHAKIVALAHAKKLPVFLHSCGFMRQIWGDIIDEMKFDGKHSYEDKIQPVEEAYEELVGRLAIIGGLDLNFVCLETPEKIYQRSRAMVERTRTRGGYALGTGNSIPEYVPWNNYLAMIKAALDG